MKTETKENNSSECFEENFLKGHDMREGIDNELREGTLRRYRLEMMGK